MELEVLGVISSYSVRKSSGQFIFDGRSRIHSEVGWIIGSHLCKYIKILKFFRFPNDIKQ
jgi:hypothetical protein